jgi:hypothetical protein
VTSFLNVPNHNPAVNTWVSDGAAPLGALRPPYPQDIFHYIRVNWNPGYPTSMKIYGAIAQGYPKFSYEPPPNPPQPGPAMSVSGNSWDKECPNVVLVAEGVCEMDIAQGGAPSTARVQCIQVDYQNRWSIWRQALGRPAEYRLPFR